MAIKIATCLKIHVQSHAKQNIRVAHHRKACFFSNLTTNTGVCKTVMELTGFGFYGQIRQKVELCCSNQDGFRVKRRIVKQERTQSPLLSICYAWGAVFPPKDSGSLLGHMTS